MFKAFYQKLILAQDITLAAKYKLFKMSWKKKKCSVKDLCNLRN